MMKPFRRRPRTERVADPQASARRGRYERQLADHERTHPPDTKRLEAARAEAHALWEEGERARREIAAMGAVPFILHPQQTEEGWVAREPGLLLEAVGRSEKEALGALVDFIHEQMVIDPVRVLEVLQARQTPKNVEVTI